MLRIYIPLLIATLSLNAICSDFNFKDPKGINTVIFRLDSVLEPIAGTAGGVSGTLSYDVQNPSKMSGKLIIDAKSLSVPNAMMTKYMHSKQWLNVAKFPTIELKILKVIKANAKSVQAEVEFTCKGISKTMNVTFELNYLKDSLHKRVPKLKGDLLILKTQFSLKRKDFNIKPKMDNLKVAEIIKITVSICGMSLK